MRVIVPIQRNDMKTIGKVSVIIRIKVKTKVHECLKKNCPK